MFKVLVALTIALPAVSLAKSKATDEFLATCQLKGMGVSVVDYAGEGVRATVFSKATGTRRSILLGTSRPILFKSTNKAIEYTGPNFSLVVTRNLETSPLKGVGVLNYNRLNRKIHLTKMACRLY